MTHQKGQTVTHQQKARAGAGGRGAGGTPVGGTRNGAPHHRGPSVAAGCWPPVPRPERNAPTPSALLPLQSRRRGGRNVKR